VVDGIEEIPRGRGRKGNGVGERDSSSVVIEDDAVVADVGDEDDREVGIDAIVRLAPRQDGPAT
jgi:hypothetical protein